jgi:sterol 3beta-glucosyltransferase
LQVAQTFLPMKITLLTYGSRGDVQPFLALSVGLQKAGHTVTLAAPHRFADFAGAYGVPFMPLAGDPEEISRIINDAGENTFRMINGMKSYIFSIAPQVVRDARAAIAGAEMLVHGFLFTTGAHSFARDMGIPDVSVQTFPMFAPTRAFPNVALAKMPPGALSYFSHWLATQIFWYGGNSGYYQLRRRFPDDLPRRLYWPFTPTPDRSLTPLLFAYSPNVLPRPAEWTAPNLHITGYFFLDAAEDYQPSSALTDFLAVGDAPVCISFGSMVNREAERINRVVREALALTHQRGIFLTGWGGYQHADGEENTLSLDAAPHDWLFPRCKAIIHHGGAGTTAAGLCSGRPNIVVPHTADQPFWGRRVAVIGAGPQPVPVKQLTTGRLVAALAQVEDAALRACAQETGRLIRSEDGVGAAVRIIESISQP